MNPLPPAGDLLRLFDLRRPDLNVAAAFAAIQARFDLFNTVYLGFPVSAIPLPLTDAIGRGRFFNNLGNATLTPPGNQHAWEAEQAVLRWFGDHVGIDTDHGWGQLTTGGSAGNLAGIRRGRNRFPDAILIHGARAHYSVREAADLMRIPAFEIPALPGEQIDLAALDQQLGVLRAGRRDGELAVIVVVTLGTTRTEASDDLPGVVDILNHHRITRRHIHLDAALAGLALALDGLLDLELADSVSTSLYKVAGIPRACGLVAGHRGGQGGTEQVVPYTGTTGVTGVRDGITALAAFEAIGTLGDAGHRARVHAGRDLADYTIDRLTQLGVTAWRHPGAYFTVLLDSPPPQILRKWTLGDSSDSNHRRHRMVLVPGRTKEHVDPFLADLAGEMSTVRPRPNLFATFLSAEGSPL